MLFILFTNSEHEQGYFSFFVFFQNLIVIPSLLFIIFMLVNHYILSKFQVFMQFFVIWFRLITLKYIILKFMFFHAFLYLFIFNFYQECLLPLKIIVYI